MKLLDKVEIAETNQILLLIVPSKNYKCVSCTWNITYMLIIGIIYQKYDKSTNITYKSS